MAKPQYKHYNYNIQLRKPFSIQKSYGFFRKNILLKHQAQ